MVQSFFAYVGEGDVLLFSGKQKTHNVTLRDAFLAHTHTHTKLISSLQSCSDDDGLQFHVNSGHKFVHVNQQLLQSSDLNLSA